MDIQLKGGFTTHDRRLDRIPQFDAKSLNYPAMRGLAAYAPRGYTWSVPRHLDQGQEGACVGFGFGADGLARPNPVLFIDNKYAQEVYIAAQKVDDWEGEDYEGTSVLAGAKVMHSRGFFDEYQWSYDLDSLVLSVGYKGPAIIGVNWYEGMLDTDSDGFIRATGEIMGGHCTLIYKVSYKNRYFGIWNSWSESWGVNGTAKISFDDMEFLLSKDEMGEACIPVNRHNFVQSRHSSNQLIVGKNILEE